MRITLHAGNLFTMGVLYQLSYIGLCRPDTKNWAILLCFTPSFNADDKCYYCLMETNATLLACIQLAIESHAGQTRRLLGTPYIIHPVRMARELESIGASHDAIAAALLHDVIEDRKPYDPKLMFEKVTQTAGARVAEIVDNLSELKQDNGEDLPWKVRVTEALERLINSNDRDAWLVKVADMLDNSRDLAESIRTFGYDAVQKHFNAPITERVKKSLAFADIIRERDPDNLLLSKLDTVLIDLNTAVSVETK